MKKPNRIGLSLFDEELLSLINASAKIFPITQDMVNNNLNPDNYEYGKLDRAIYKWLNDSWDYIIADDIDIVWSDIDEKPTTFPPSNHTHTELHTHDNKSALNIVTSALIDSWNSAVNHITDAIKHITNEERTLWNTVSNKSNSTHNHDAVYSKLEHTHDYSPSSHNHDTIYSKLTHNHDGAYYKKSEVDTKLGTKSNTGHTHTEVDITNLDKYTQVEVNNLLSGKADVEHTHSESEIIDLDKYSKSEVDTKLAKKSDTTHTHSDLHTHSNKVLLDKLVETEVNVSYDLSNLDYIEDIRNGYTEGHSHDNFTVLQGITEILVDGWNSAVNHISDTIKHITSSERTLWNTVSNKSDIGHTHEYSPLNHNHNETYYTELEVNTLLNDKSDTTHTHIDKADKSYVDDELSKKADNTTMAYHVNSNEIHVTQDNKDNWNAKVNTDDSRLSDSRIPLSHNHIKANITDFAHTHLITDLPPYPTLASLGASASTHNHSLGSLSEKSYTSLTDKPTIPTKLSELEADVELGGNFATIGIVKPTDGSMWYEVI